MSTCTQPRPAAPARPTAPAVTIGMTVYNEARWLEQTLESLLSQTDRDFELLVMDNASDDGTREIAERFAARDSRVAYCRHETNVGGIESFHRAVVRAQGEFFLFVAGHDLYSPNYVESLRATLEAAPKAALAFGRSVFIDENGCEEGPVKGLCATEGMSSPVRRFNIYMWANQEPIYGLVRTAILRQTRTDLQIMTSGHVLLQELAILGEFVYVHEATFYRRRNRERERPNERRARNYRALFASPKRPWLPYWRSCWEICRAAFRGKLKGRNRRRQRVQLLLSSLLGFVRFMPHLADDLSEALRLRQDSSGDND